MIGEGFADALAAAQAGEEDGFAVLYRDLNGPVVRYLGAHAPAEAEDLAAETWMAAARNLPGFEGDERSFRAWLFTIAHRRLVQHWRDRTRRPSVPVADEAFRTRPATDDTEADALGASASATAVRAIAASLSRDQAQVVLLRVLGGLGVEEVATILGKRPGTVRVLQHKALRNLARRATASPPAHSALRTR